MRSWQDSSEAEKRAGTRLKIAVAATKTEGALENELGAELEVAHSKKLEEALEFELKKLDFARANELAGELVEALGKALVARETELEKTPANESEAALVEKLERAHETKFGLVLAS